MRFILLIAWLVPLLGAVALLYSDMTPEVSLASESNRAMRTRMCLEHADLARSEPANSLARTAVTECIGEGYIAEADGIKAID